MSSNDLERPRLQCHRFSPFCEFQVSSGSAASSNQIMPPQTVTFAAESESDPGIVIKVLTDVEKIPGWAPVFADSVERISDTHCRVRKNGQIFDLEVAVNTSAGTVDYIREMSQGRRGGAYIRVTPRPLGGSSICMTVPIGADTTEAEVRKVLADEVSELIRMARS